MHPRILLLKSPHRLSLPSYLPRTNVPYCRTISRRYNTQSKRIDYAGNHRRRFGRECRWPGSFTDSVLRHRLMRCHRSQVRCQRRPLKTPRLNQVPKRASTTGAAGQFYVSRRQFTGPPCGTCAYRSVVITRAEKAMHFEEGWTSEGSALTGKDGVVFG